MCLNQLNNDIWRSIYEYDNTYKIKYESEVIPTLWQQSWVHWYKNNPYSEDPFVMSAITEFLHSFGMFRSPFTNDVIQTFVSKTYFVSDILITTRIINRKLFRIQILFRSEYGTYINPAIYDVYKLRDGLLDNDLYYCRRRSNHLHSKRRSRRRFI